MKRKQISGIVAIIFLVLSVFSWVGCSDSVNPIIEKYFPNLNTSSHLGNYATIYPDQISHGDIKDWIENELYEKLDFVLEDSHGRFFDYQENIKNNLAEIKELLVTPYFKVYYLVADKNKFFRQILIHPDPDDQLEALNNYLTNKDEDIVEIGTLYHPYQVVDAMVHFPRSKLFKSQDKKYYYQMEQ